MTENESPEIALREALDAHGPFARTAEGTLEWDDYVSFRAIVARQAERFFKVKRAELDTRKLQAYKDKNQRDYVEIFREGQREFKGALAAFTRKAGEHIVIEA